MPLTSGTQVGPYEIISPAGAGGMGEVYRARDGRLNRDVAIKVLPAAFSRDPERLRRFQQEAQAVAALDHPNILSIHDFGEHDGAPYIVTEFLDGETLRARLNGGALPSRKATEYAEQIVRGLAAAHDKDIVHRDLKPENIFVTRDGRVKILDFGLAKLMRPEAPQPDAATLPLQTEPGVVMGTVGYMSPEQVKGQAADHRSDIFSFGAILYEMLSGKHAFQGGSSVETMSAILKEDPPDLAEPTRNISPALDRIVHHCLEKNPEERFQSARDVAFNLASLSQMSGSSTTPPQTRQKRSRLPLLALGAALVVAAFVAGYLSRRGHASAPIFHRMTVERGALATARFSPDGHTIVYSAAWQGGRLQMFSTRAEFPEPQSLGLQDSVVLSISASNEMAILLGARPGWGGGTLARAPLSGGTPRPVLENVRDVSWAPDGNFVISHMVNGRDRLEYPVGKVLYETGGFITDPRLSPKGDTIAFLEHTVFPDSRGAVAIVDLAGHKKTLTREFESVNGMAWSATGDEIWFTASPHGNEEALHAVTPAGSQRVVLSIPSVLRLQDIAPDGRVLVAAEDDRFEIDGRAANAKAESDLTRYEISVLTDISADGKSILFNEQGELGGPNYSVGMRDLLGSPPVRLGEGYSGEFSPDGKWAMAYDNGPPPKLTLLPVGAGEPKTVPLLGIERILGAGFFPDGLRVWVNGSEAGHTARCYAQYITGSELRPITPDDVLGQAISPDGNFVVGADPQGKLALFPVAGGPGRDVPGLATGFTFVQWTLGGKSMYVSDLNLPATIYEVNLASGKKSILTRLTMADPAGVMGMIRVALSRDGKSYAYNYVRILSKLQVVEGLK